MRKNKKRHYDFVALSPHEYQKLIDAYGNSIINQYIQQLNNYIGSTGRRYKSHYYTILVWLNKDGIKKQPKKEPPKGRPDPEQREKVARLIKETAGKMK